MSQCLTNLQVSTTTTLSSGTPSGPQPVQTPAQPPIYPPQPYPQPYPYAFGPYPPPPFNYGYPPPYPYPYAPYPPAGYYPPHHQHRPDFDFAGQVIHAICHAQFLYVDVFLFQMSTSFITRHLDLIKIRARAILMILLQRLLLR